MKAVLGSASSGISGAGVATDTSSSSGPMAPGAASDATTSGEASRRPETWAGIGPEEAGYKVTRRALWSRFEEATLEERSTMANYMVFIHTALGTLAGYMVREGLHR